MSSVGSGHPGGGNSQEFELNLAPIIDCFTVLIAFMLASTAFISIEILDTATAGTASAEQIQTPAPSLRVDLQGDESAIIKVMGPDGKSNLFSNRVPAAQLKEEVKSIHGRFPALQDATLQSSDGNTYAQMVLALEAVKHSIPSVSISLEGGENK